MSAQLNEQLKTALLQAWADGQRELVIITFKMATIADHRDVATWIHTEFVDQYTAEELDDLTDFAVCLIIEKLAAAHRIAAMTQDAGAVAKDAIAKAMQH